MSSQQLDNFMSYNILIRLGTPFSHWEACKLGIIDDKGTVLKKQGTLSDKEKNVFGKFDIICLNLKKIIDKIPQYKVAMAPLNLLQSPPFSDNIGSNISLGVLSGTLFLLRESVEDPDNFVFLNEKLNHYSKIIQKLYEDGEGGVPANNVGGGNIAGTGVGPSGEPGVPPNTPYKKKNKKDQNVLIINIRRLMNKVKG